MSVATTVSGIANQTQQNVRYHINYLVPISSGWRMLIIIYFMIWQTFTPILSNVLHGTNQDYLASRSLLSLTTNLLIILPFFVRKFGGYPIGWLHPLVFPTLLSLAIGLVRSPISIIFPFVVWAQPTHDNFYQPLLVGWSDLQLSALHLKGEFLNFLSVLSLYAGFLLLKFKVPRIKLYSPRNLKLSCYIIFGIISSLCIWLLASKGGIVNHISSFGLGREFALENVGHIAGIIRFAPLMFGFWYLFEPRIIRNPFFLALLLVSLVMQFIVTGSRSSTMYPLMFILAIWVFHNRKIPTTRVVLLGFVGFLAIGVLGQIRQSSQGQVQQADFSSLTEFNLQSAISATVNDLRSRAEISSYLSTIAKVPEPVNLLWGETYVGAFAFFIPSVIWEDKPRGIGAYTGAMIWLDYNLVQARNYKGAPRPPGAVAEAYWNFHIPGIILVFFLFGAYKQWLLRILFRYEAATPIMCFYLYTVFYLTSPVSPLLVNYFRNTVFLFFFLSIIRVFRIRIKI